MFGAASSMISSIPPTPNSFASSSSSSSSSNGRKSKAPLSLLPPASRIFVKNLSYTTGEASLIRLLSKFGPIVEVKLARHEDTRRSKGYAFVQYTCRDDAILAMEHMDQMMIDGRIVCAEIAKPWRSGSRDYPRSLGPPCYRNLEADVVGDHVEGDHLRLD